MKILEEQSTFDEIMVWDHEVAPAADDPFVKGVEEWVRLAEAVWLSSFWSWFGLANWLDEFEYG